MDQFIRSVHRRPRVAVSRSVLLRSEEHTSELQSLAYLVCRLLLEKKKLLRATPAPSEAEIKRTLEGNIFRCGTYNQIVSAVQNAAVVMTAHANEHIHA